MIKFEVGPSAKTEEGVFVQASSARFSAQASGRQTVWQSTSVPLPPYRRVKVRPQQQTLTPES
jgi:hypothetical protein